VPVEKNVKSKGNLR